MDIVVVGAIDWDSPVSLPVHHVVTRLAKNNRVIYVDNFGGSRPLRRNDLRRAGGKLRRAFLRRVGRTPAQARRVPNVEVVQPLVLPLPPSPLVDRINGILVARTIRAAMRRRGFEEPVLWTRAKTPAVVEALRGIPRSLLVFQEVDQGFLSPVVPERRREQMRRATQALVDASDVLFASARSIHEARKDHPQAHFFPNGVDVDLFRTPQDPPPLVAERRVPRVVFAGHIGGWVDVELLEAVAREMPDVEFLLLGAASVAVDALARLPNVVLPGPVPFQTLPGHLQASDVGIIPYRLTGFTAFTFPSKLLEYVAAGLPVVSTPLPEVVRFRPHVRTAATAERFVNQLRQAIAGEGTAPHEGIDLERYSWDRIVAEMEACLEARLVGTRMPTT